MRWLALAALVLPLASFATPADAADPPPFLQAPPSWEARYVKELRHDILVVGWWPSGAKKGEQHQAKGRRWTGSFYAPKDVKIDAPEKFALERLKAQGWTIEVPSGAIVAHRTVAGHEAWMKFFASPDHWAFDVVEENTTPRVPKVVPPTAAIETIADNEDFPYLGHFEGQKFESAKTTDVTFVIPHPGGKPETVFGPVQHKVYRGAEEVSPYECMIGYREALSGAGWTLDTDAPHDNNMSNGIVAAHFAKNGRDLHVGILCNRTSTYYDVLDGAAAAQEQKLKKELAEKGKIALYGIYFDVDSDQLRAESEGTLQQIRKLLQSDGKLKLEIDGHTDDTGTADHNKTLSEKRAASVRKWLVEHGIDGARLTTAGFGATKPVAENKSDEGRAKNRRVELVKK